MTEKIVLQTVTRIEGHGKVSIFLDGRGEVERAHFHAVELRGFEKFCQGRMVWEMPLIMPRICGICSTSHHLAAAKACDNLFGVHIPPTAVKLRTLMNLGQIIHSQAEHFFFLASPDYFLGPDYSPTDRSLIGLMKAAPESAGKAIQLRKFGSTICDMVGGRTIHPVSAIPGGMSKPLTHEQRFTLLKDAESVIDLALWAVKVAREIVERYASEFAPAFGTFPTPFLALTQHGQLEFYDGPMRIIGEDGQALDEFAPRGYLQYLGEQVADHTWMKFPFYLRKGWPDGSYRVGALARLNVAQGIDTPLADEELREFKRLGNGHPVFENFYYHYARCIEMLHAVEKARALLLDDEIVGDEVRVKVERHAGEGVGVVEAARGTLIHHFRADETGKVEMANLVVATVHNSAALDRTVAGAARHFVHGGKIEEGILNRVEMAIRCFDPCISCATHAAGRMPLEITLIARDGEEIDTISRG